MSELTCSRRHEAERNTGYIFSFHAHLRCIYRNEVIQRPSEIDLSTEVLLNIYILESAMPELCTEIGPQCPLMGLAWDILQILRLAFSFSSPFPVPMRPRHAGGSKQNMGIHDCVRVGILVRSARVLEEDLDAYITNLTICKRKCSHTPCLSTSVTEYYST
jgi:hypothetical protein